MQTVQNAQASSLKDLELNKFWLLVLRFIVLRGLYPMGIHLDQTLIIKRSLRLIFGRLIFGNGGRFVSEFCSRFIRVGSYKTVFGLSCFFKKRFHFS